MKTIYFEVDAGIDMHDLIEAVEDEGYTVLEKEDSKRGSEPQNLFESLCEQFGLPRAATSKQDLLKHINSLL